MKNKYLVTGAAGFIGSAVSKMLIKNGHEVWSIDNLETGYDENIPEGVNFIKGNCQDERTLQNLNKVKFDAIFHLAGQSSGEVSFDDPVYDLRTNTESTLKLINYGLDTGCLRFIYASSMSVYGDVPDKPIPESFHCSPLSFYGVGKLASENYLRIYQKKGLQPTSLRFFNVYGPGQNLSNLRQGMVSIYLAQLLNSKEIIVKGSLDRYRDFIYIDDIVRISMKCLENDITINKIYNVGTGIKTKVRDLLNKLIKLSGEDIKIIMGQSTPGDQMGITADISSIFNDLNMKNLIPIDYGLETMMKWAKTNN